MPVDKARLNHLRSASNMAQWFVLRTGRERARALASKVDFRAMGKQS
jgi:hypothetical protein